MTPASPGLTPRQLEILRLIAAGYTEEAVGARLGLTRHTVKEHLARARARLGAANTTHAVVAAIREGLLDLKKVPKRRVKPPDWALQKAG